MLYFGGIFEPSRPIVVEDGSSCRWNRETGRGALLARRMENAWLKRNGVAGCGDTKNAWVRFGGTFDIEGKRRALAEREVRMTEPGFWDDHEKAREVIQEV